MSNDKLPIKFFAPREIDELRVEPGGNSEPPKWLLEGSELAQRSQLLSNAFSNFENIMLNKRDKESAVPFVFVAKMCDDATAKSRRKEISTFFQTSEQSNVLGLVSTDQLIVRLDSISEMHQIASRLKDYTHNNYAISCLEEFLEFEPCVNLQEEKTEYKVRLIDFQDYERNLAIQRLFERALISKEIAFKKTLYAEQVPVYKLVHVDKTCIDSLRNADVYEAIFSIEPMPKYVLSLDFLSNEAPIEILLPQEGQSYATVGILDNGIARIPHLEPWLVDKRWTVYPDSSIKPTHGTFVAGIALYGDILDKNEWVGHHGIKIFDAAVFPDTNKEGLDEDELIANIKEAISANHEKVKIWNISISIIRPVCDDKFSDFAIALDALQDQFNVMICKSAGNCSNFIKGLPKGRIHEGADSVRSLVVGSVAHEKGAFDFAEADNPSPFSRIGPGPEYIIKPEISHYGGNAGLDSAGKLVTTGVKSFSNDGTISSAVGTSFSTPRIASLAAGLYQELNEDFDPLLIKALIVHSASYSKNLTVPVTERTKQLGFGVPKSVRDIIYNAPHEATLILRDSLTKGEYIDIMDFPMPTCLIHNGFFTGQIIATLVYDPILDPTQGIEYCQSNVDVKFGSYDAKTERDISKRNILNPVGRQGAQNLFRGNLYSKQRMKEKTDDFALKERLRIQYEDKYYPVKKYAVDLSELTDSNKLHYVTADKNWYLYIRGLFRDHIERKAALESMELSQEICLVLTIRDPSEKGNVYDEVTQKLDEFNFWHTSIKITNDINISI